MSQQRFSDIERRALWEAHLKRCLYCRRPLLFNELFIDHVLPENLLADPKRWAEIKASHGLGATFDLQSEFNLAPACHSCNTDKLARILPPERVAIIFAKINDRVPEVLRLRRKYECAAGADDAMLGLICALQAGTISSDQVEKIVQRFDTVNPNLTLYKSIEFLDGVVVSELSKADVEFLLDRPVKLGTDLLEGLELHNGCGQTVAVRTTREYRRAMQQGCYASTTFAMKMESFFVLPNAALGAMDRARPSRASFIREPRVGLVDLQFMPVSMLPSMTGEHDEDDCETLADVVAKGNLIVTSSTSSSISFEYGGMSRILFELMRADLDADGVEDVLIFGYDRAIGGTFGGGFATTLTRKSLNGLFEEILR